jgi:hypothetical protein
MRLALAVVGVVGCGSDTPSLPAACDEAADRGIAPITASIATCGLARPGLELPGCEPPDGPAAVLRFEIPVAGRYEICPEAGTGARAVAAATCPPVEPVCTDSGTCAEATVEAPGPLFVIVAGPAPDSCPILDVAITAIDDDSGEADCLDGRDDDGDGFVDCEDRGCQLGGDCDSGAALPEACDRQDDAAVPPFGAGVVDELACRCTDDAGCDGLATGSPERFICHEGFAGGVCGPRCDADPAWCAVAGGVCSQGRCTANAAQKKAPARGGG